MLMIIYVALFLFTVHFALLYYSASTYLIQFVPKQGLEAVFIIASIMAMAGLTVLPSIMRRKGQRTTTLWLLGLLILATLTMGYGASTVSVAGAFLALFALQSVLHFDFDIYIERYSKTKETGRDRGMALTVMSIAIAASPYLAGFIIDTYGFQMLYIVGAALLVPVFIIAAWLNHVKDLKYHKAPFFRTLRALHKRKDLWNAFMANVLLQFFYVWMSIYTPLYLVETLGFTWSIVGVILTVMLLPFVILEYPAGYLADKVYGERGMLAAGFIIMGLSTLVLPFITSTNAAVWAILLFVTRIGASFIEIMSETYFFKKVGPENTDLISFFRESRPLAYLGGTLLAAVILPIINYDYSTLFLIMGVVILLGTRHAFGLKSTR